MASTTHDRQTSSPAKLKPELSRYAWVLWTYQGNLPIREIIECSSVRLMGLGKLNHQPNNPFFLMVSQGFTYVIVTIHKEESV